MYEIEMTRDRLKQCIENGISRAEALGSSLYDSEEVKLRAVGETTKHVAYGQWTHSNEFTCGCPLVEAGLRDPDDFETPSLRYSHFTVHYDTSVRHYLNGWPEARGVIHVKG